MDGSTPEVNQLSSSRNTSKQECKDLCRAEDECCSFAWSPTWRTCYLSPECDPTGPAHGDFFFCQKDYFEGEIPAYPNSTVFTIPGNDIVAGRASNSSQTTEVYCCNSDGSSKDISFYNKHTVRTCGAGVSCVDICVSTQNISVVSSGSLFSLL